jgi:GNAT superfamily N-acetyltransferase
MNILAEPSDAAGTFPLRTRYREEANGQIVLDSIHRRDGWTLSHLLIADGREAGFGSVAIGGPWKDKPTIFEFYLLPEHRSRAFAFFEVFLRASGARYFEVQTSDELLTVMLHCYGREIASEKIVFRDQFVTALPANGAILRPVTSREDIQSALEARQGGGEWALELEGNEVGKGGILFHYNRPYGDIYMEITGPFRRRGLGAYFVQELKREAYRLGAIPCARCSPANIPSRQTIQKAGFIPFAHILNASIPTK